MSTEHLSGLLRRLDNALANELRSTDADGELLEQFLTARDYAAIRTIISRHGPMVYRVCRRILGNEHDAEDAFQAAFLILVRKGNSIRKWNSLAGWLHSVAYQVSMRVRTSSRRRRVRENHVVRDEAVVSDQSNWREVRSIVDEELAQLPEAQREPLVLCYLQGLTQDEAAVRLGLPKRTLQRRLQLGRERLGDRLTRRGFGSSEALVAYLLSEFVVAMPSALAETTASIAEVVGRGKTLSSHSHAIRSLSQEVIRKMFPNRLKLKLAVIAILGLSLATAAIGSLLADGQPPEPLIPLAIEQKKDDKANNKVDNPVDGVAWGETVEGLKAGISFRAGEEHSSRLGGSATFVVFLRNEGKKPISIAFNENVFDEFIPTVQDAGGKNVKVHPGPMFLGMVSRVDRTLDSGETIRLGTAWFLIKETTWRGTVVSPTLRAERGKYRISCNNFPFRRQGRDADEMLWSTGAVELSILSEAQVDPGNAVKIKEENDEQSQVDLAYEFIRTNNFASAELSLRKQLRMYPSGAKAPLGRLLLGVTLLQLASVNPLADQTLPRANAQREEALQLFRAIVNEEDAKLKKDGKLNERDAWVREQAAIRVLQALLQTKNHADLLIESQELLRRYKGTIDELIILSLIFHSFKQQGDTVKMLQTRDKMKELFDSLPATAFNSSTIEQSREYWEKTWFVSERWRD